MRSLYRRRVTDIPSPAVPRVLSGPARWLLQALAGFCLFLAVMGIVLPVLPTVPFLVAAAWAAARSSPRLHRWLLAHPRFGQHLADWYEAGIVSRRAKWFSTAMMAASAASMPLLIPARFTPVAIVMLLGMAAVLVWLWRCPERRP
jgi:uncharacterized membrane protein YbaN (DUF454 family)